MGASRTLTASSAWRLHRWIAAAGLCTAIVVMRAGARDGSAEFDLSRHDIPVERIVSGGPPKDGIPALVEPRFVSADAATFLTGDDRVVGVTGGGLAKAYPLGVLNWHEVVNDRVGDRRVVVTYCPLTASAVVFDRTVDGDELTFGVSGRLYESNVLFYDHQSESLWSQLKSQAVTGRMTARSLRPVPAVETTWHEWRRRHPNTVVLSIDTGYQRDYGRNPYAAYDASPGMMFSTSHVDTRLFVKDRVLGIVVGDVARAYPIARLAAAETPVRDRVGEIDVTIRFDGATKTAEAFAGERPLSATVVYWFAWSTFHPETEIWADTASRGVRSRRPDDVRVAKVRGYWSSMMGVLPDGSTGEKDSGPGIYVISGELSNVSNQPVHHVELQFELLDAAGRVVHSAVGLNRSAESLRPGPGGATGAGDARPIAPGGVDTFRMLFFGDELPKFADTRVSVLTVE